MNTLLAWFIFLEAVAPVGLAEITSETLLIRLHPEQIQPGQRATLELRLSSADHLTTTQPVIHDQLLSSLKNLEILDQHQELKSNDWQSTYEITSYEIGKIRIPPIEVVWGPNTYSSHATELTVISGRSENDTELRMDPAPLSAPILWRKIALTLLSLGIFSILGYLSYRYLKKPRKKPLAFVVSQAPVDTETAVAFLNRRLQEIKLKAQQSGEMVSVVDELVAVWRIYLAMTIQEPAPCWTTSELSQRLIGHRFADELIELFSDCDTHRFSQQGKSSIGTCFSKWLDHSTRMAMSCGS